MTHIDWESSQTDVLINPRFPKIEREEILTLFKQSPALPGHLWLSTSGSSGQIKWVALSKKALLLSAHAVNKRLKSTAADIWVNPLPLFHVGGLGIFARAYLSGAKMVDFYTASSGKWDPLLYCQTLNDSHASWSSLVPTQVYDLVVRNLTSPHSIKGIIVGGGKLNELLYQAAKNLGWKLLPSYGMTECSSQIATADLEFEGKKIPPLKILEHVEAAISAEGKIKIKSPSLLSLYAMKEENVFAFRDPKVDGWLTTEDQGEIERDILHIFGRGNSFIKIGGESSNLNKLAEIWEAVCLKHCFKGDSVLIAEEDERLGHAIYLLVLKDNQKDTVLKPILEEYNRSVMPFEKIRLVRFVEKIPRSPLGKPLKS